MLIGFHFGMWLTVYAITSEISRSECSGREHVGAPREVLLDDVVLRRAGELPGDLLRREVGVLLLGDHLVKREQPHRGGVDRHRGVHPGERDVLEQVPHLAEVRHRHADLADLTARERRVGVVAGLGRQVERDRQPGLALGEVAPVQLVGPGRRRVAGVRPHHPRTVLRVVPLGGRRSAHGPRVRRRLPAGHRRVEYLSCQVRHIARLASAPPSSSSRLLIRECRSARRRCGLRPRSVRC